VTGDSGFSVEVHLGDDCLRVSVIGELDIATEPKLVESARESILTSDAPTVVVDLTLVSFIDSSGLRGVLMCRDAAQERGLALVLAVKDGPVRRLLDVAGVADWFTYE
jgi:anti-anti-sigma factor